MPKTIIKSCRLDIKSHLLDTLVSAYLDNEFTTRASVAEKCHVSASTSGKVATALVECGFAEQRLYADNNRRPCHHIILKEGLHTLVIDLCSSVYRMIILDPYGKSVFSVHHIFDTTLSYEDNLNVFLSRGGYRAKVARKSFYAVAVIFSDFGQNELNPYSAYLPTINDKLRTDRIFRSGFIPRSISYLSRSDAFSAAISFGAIPCSCQRFGASYVFIGSHLCAFNVSGAVTTQCNLAPLMVNGSSLGAMAQGRMDAQAFCSALTKAANLMHCAFGSSSVVIDSDIYEVNEDTLAILRRDFAMVGVLSPNLIASKGESNVICSGAMKIALLKFIRTRISSSDETTDA